MYMSDSFAFCSRILSRGQVEYPRFYDLEHQNKEDDIDIQKKDQEIRSRFDVLKGKK